jgi:hypothetical protein
LQKSAASNEGATKRIIFLFKVQSYYNKSKNPAVSREVL